MATKRDRLGRILEGLDELAGSIGTQAKKSVPDLDRVFDHYVHTHEELIADLHALAIEQLEENAPDDRPSSLHEPNSLLDDVRPRVLERMRELYPTDDPDSLKVKRYGWTHRACLELLAQNVGKWVSGARLRIVLRDQVHAERRMRELRELGFQIENRQKEGRSYYELLSLEPDLDKAAHYFIKLSRGQRRR